MMKLKSCGCYITGGMTDLTATKHCRQENQDLSLFHLIASCLVDQKLSRVSIFPVLQQELVVLDLNIM